MMLNTRGITFILLLIFATLGGVGLSYSFSHKPQQSEAVAYLPALPNANLTITPNHTVTPSPLPTPLPTLATVKYIAPATATSLNQQFTQTSPDGTQILTMTVGANKNGSKTFGFATSGIDGSNVHQIYSVTYASDNMSIPFNTWSPGNTYVFINHISASGSTEVLVFRADGQPVSGSDNYVNATSLFSSQNTGFAYQEATGWSSDTLLIINTTAQDGSQGTSYWLSLPDLSIIPLATKF